MSCIEDPFVRDHGGVKTCPQSDIGALFTVDARGLWVAGVGGSIFFGCQLAGDLSEFFHARRFEPVAAQILRDSEIESKPERAFALYRYAFAGQSHRSTRVQITRGLDNFGDFQSRLHRGIVAHQESGQPLTAFVDP